MKKTLWATVLILSAAATSCSDDNTPSPSTPTPVIADGFVWKEDGGADITADSAFWTSGAWGAGIRAYKGGMANFFEINFADAALGTKDLSATYSFTFLKGTATYISTAGNCNLTTNTNDKLTGTFSTTVSGGIITNVTGKFTNLSKR